MKRESKMRESRSGSGNKLQQSAEQIKSAEPILSWLTFWLNNRQISLKALSSATNISIHTLRRILRGARPNLSTLERIAHFFQIELPAEIADAAVNRRCRCGLSRLPEYRAWANMRQRCQNRNHPDYKLYGGRGITIAPRWLHPQQGFLNFLADMGRRPGRRHSLHRSPANANYVPERCKWATPEEQARERRDKVVFEVNGEVLTEKQAIERMITDGIVYAVEVDEFGTFKPLRKRRRRKRAKARKQPRSKPT